MNYQWQTARKFAAAGELDRAAYYYRKAIADMAEPSQSSLIYRELAAISPPLEAVDLYQKILAIDPGDLSSYLAIGEIYQAQGWSALALEQFCQATYLAPQAFDLAAHLQLLQNLAAQHLWPQVIKAGLRVLEVNPAPEIYAQVGVAYGATGQLWSAWQLFEHGADLIPAASYNRLGVAFSQQQIWNYGANCFTKAITLQPDYADAHANLGNVFWQTGDLKNAMLCFQEAIAIDPNFTQVYYNLGLIMADLERLEEAALLLETAIALQPDFGLAHLHLTRVQQQAQAANVPLEPNTSN
ncbi:MAG: tetratricopeptide repeat protein [Pseudanabaenaceae cyanobacterium bins.68]|nr:tetratricopeptide repeat protein [Pseudanabaenaceae cyanobacterium bins.68]